MIMFCSAVWSCKVKTFTVGWKISSFHGCVAACVCVHVCGCVWLWSSKSNWNSFRQNCGCNKSNIINTNTCKNFKIWNNLKSLVVKCVGNKTSRHSDTTSQIPFVCKCVCSEGFELPGGFWGFRFIPLLSAMISVCIRGRNAANQWDSAKTNW